MEIIHITETKNVNSILEKGILRRPPLLSQYAEIMKYHFEDNYDEEKGLVFAIPEGLNRRDKYIKDFVYWKCWGDQRNIYLIDNDDLYDDFQEQGPKCFSHLKTKELHFSILLVEIESKYILSEYVHEQSQNMGVLWSDMDSRYEHNNKPLSLLNFDIDPVYIKDVIGNVETYLSYNNKFNVFLNI